MSNPCPPEKAIVANLALGDPVANPRGGKACSITPAIRLTLQDVTTPFQVSAYDGTSSRKSLDLRSTPALREFCARLDAKLEPLATLPTPASSNPRKATTSLRSAAK